MLYLFLIILNIIPNLYAEKKLTTFQVSTIVLNSCKNFIDEDYVGFNYDTSGELANSFLDNIRIKCTKETSFNLNINNTNDFQNYDSNETNYSPLAINNENEDENLSEFETNDSIVNLNSKLRYLRRVSANKSSNKSFYEVINVTITF